MTTIRQFRPLRAAILCVLACASVGPLAACYTLVQHPRIASLNYQRPQGKSCTGCHTEKAVRGFLEPERLAPQPPPWDSLTDPWWIASDDSTDGGG